MTRHNPTRRWSLKQALRAIRAAQTSTANARVASHLRPLERAALTRCLAALADALRHAKTARRMKARRQEARAA